MIIGNIFEETIQSQQQELIENNKSLENIIKDAIVVLDPQQRIINCNYKFEETFGYTKQEILGQLLAPLICDNLDETIQNINYTLTGHIISGNAKRRRKDNTFIPVQYTGAPIIVNDKITKVFIIYKDITEEVEQEANYKNAVNYSQIAIITQDLSLLKTEIDILAMQNITLQQYIKKHPQENKRLLNLIQNVSINPFALTMYSAKNEHEINQNLHKIIPNTIKLSLIKKLINLQGYGTIHFDCQTNTLDGRQIETHIKAHIPQEYEKNWKRIFFNIADITARKKQEAIEKENEKLKGVLEMAGGACHNINQPLMIILGTSELLSDDIKSAKTQLEQTIDTINQLPNNTLKQTLLYQINEFDKNNSLIQKHSKTIFQQTVRAGEITKQIMNIKSAITTPYTNDKIQIIDINKSSQ